MSVFQRRLASSTSALLCSFERRIGKLERDIAERRTGNLDEVRRRRRERCLASRRREDFFDTHGAAEDIREDGAALGDGSEDFELEVLLDKLESVRCALSSDKVFDVIGRLLENTSLREYMMASAITRLLSRARCALQNASILREYMMVALTIEGEQRALQDIERAVTGSAVRNIAERQVKVYGGSGEVAPRRPGMRRELDRERYLLPAPAAGLPAPARRTCAGLSNRSRTSSASASRAIRTGCSLSNPLRRVPSILSCRH